MEWMNDCEDSSAMSLVEAGQKLKNVGKMPVWVLPKSADEIEFHSYSQKMQQYKLYWLCESLRGDTTVQACCTVEEWCDTKWEKKVLYQNTLEYGSVSISMRD